MSDQPPFIKKTRWHRILGNTLEQWLTPVGIQVQTELAVMTDPPKVDILLLRKTNSNKQHKQRLADGLRDSQASNLVIEFKYTESFKKTALIQALHYDAMFTDRQKRSTKDVDTFLIYSKTPRKTTLEQLGFFETKNKGVYKSNAPLVDRITLITLNELSNEAHNLTWKCFASRKSEIKRAFSGIRENKLGKIDTKLEWILDGLWRVLSMGEDKMKALEIDELTPEYLMKAGQEWVDHLLYVLPVEERLKGLKPEDRLKGLEPEDRLKGLTSDQLKKLKEKLKDI